MSELTKQALKVENNTNFPNNNTGYITPALLREFNTDMIDSTVNQGVYNTDSGSWNQSINSLNQFTSSATGLSTGSLLITASAVTNVITFTKGNGTTFDVTVETGSASTDLTSLNQFSASQLAKDLTLASYTASNDQKWNTLGGQSGSWITESETGSFARTNTTNTFTANQTINADLNVSGTINAYKLNVVIESSSVIFSSGSNILGDAATDTQTLYGSTNVVNQLTASGLHYPTADNGIYSFMQTDGAGNLSLQYVKTLYQNIRNMETSSILLGTPLYVSGATGDNANVYIAQAGNPLRYPATLIAGDATLAASATGKAIVSGEIKGPDTSLYTPGTVIYLGALGGWTATRPTGSATQVQILGVVTKQGINGEGLVMNQLGTELPNIQQGYTWVGNVNGTPTAVATSSFASLTDLSSLNQFTASQNTKNTTLENVTSSLQAFTASQNTKNTTLQGVTSSLQSYTASQNTINQNVSLSASIYEAKFATIGTQSGSWGGGGGSDLTSLNAFTASQFVSNSFFATTGSNNFVGNQTITGSVTISSSANFDLVITGSGIFSSNDGIGTTTIGGQNVNTNTTKTVSTAASHNIFGPTGSNAQLYIGVFDDPGFTTDVEYNVIVDSTGIKFRDFDNGTAFDYIPFMTIAPNLGNNPTPVMTRGLEVTGSTNIQNLTASLQQGYVWVGAANGKTTTVATSSFGGGGSTFPYTGDAVITGSLLISGSNPFDLAITGAMQVSTNDGLGKSTIAGNNISVNNTKGTSATSIQNYGPTGSNAGLYMGVYDDPNFNTDVETAIIIDSNGISFKDWDNGSAFDYVNWLTIEPNTGNNPAPRFTRGLQITNNLSITGSTSFSSSIQFVDRSANNTNIYLGTNALGMGTSGTKTLARGNTSSIAIGNGAMRYASGSTQNVAIGPDALANTTGSNNFALGSSAMFSNTNGSQNVAIGTGALYNNTTGGGNTAIGNDTLILATIFDNQTAIGNAALSSMLSAGSSGQNVAIGNHAMKNVVTGSANTAIGTAALRDPRYAEEIVAIGFLAGYNASGAITANTIIGSRAGQKVAANDNTFIGYSAGSELTIGAGNTFIGRGNGTNITTTNYNTLIGANLSGNSSWNNVIALSDGTGAIKAQYSGSAWALSGSVSVERVLQLGQLNPLPSGVDGQLAVSASNLYFFSGSAWNKVAFA